MESDGPRRVSRKFHVLETQRSLKSPRALPSKFQQVPARPNHWWFPQIPSPPPRGALCLPQYPLLSPLPAPRSTRGLPRPAHPHPFASSRGTLHWGDDTCQKPCIVTMFVSHAPARQNSRMGPNFPSPRVHTLPASPLPLEVEEDLGLCETSLHDCVTGDGRRFVPMKSKPSSRWRSVHQKVDYPAWAWPHQVIPKCQRDSREERFSCRLWMLCRGPQARKRREAPQSRKQSLANSKQESGTSVLR